MRIEFWYTILSYPLLFAWVVWYAQKIEQGNILIILLIISAGICAYYFLKFRQLYQKINTQDFSTFHKLLNLRYELVLNTELYKAYYVCYIPLMFSAYFVAYGVHNNSIQHLLLIVVMTIVASLLILVFGKIWLREFYGKYIVQISDLVMELSNEKDDFVYDRKALSKQSKFKMYNKTSVFFDKKFGDLGVIFNFMFWLFIGILGIFILAFIAGVVIGFTQVYLNN